MSRHRFCQYKSEARLISRRTVMEATVRTQNRSPRNFPLIKPPFSVRAIAINVVKEDLSGNLTCEGLAPMGTLRPFVEQPVPFAQFGRASPGGALHKKWPG